MSSRPERREAFASYVIFIASALALVSPLLRNMRLWPTGTIAESSVYSLDRHLYFAQFFHAHSVFMAGERSAFIAAYAPWYFLWNCFAAILPDSIAYLTLVAVLYALALFFLAKLLLLASDSPQTTSSTIDWGVACLLGLLYLSSPSIFNFLKSNIFFSLPYLVLPILLFLALKYLRSGDARFVVGLLFVGVFIADLNIAHAAIVVLLVDLFLVSQRSISGLSWRSFLKRALLINSALLPGLCWMLAATYANTSYPGTLASFAAAAAENMYGNNARYLNIFAQLTDWGLFGSWNGVPYYAFAQFYAALPVWLLSLLPYGMLGFAVCVSQATAALKRAASWLLLGAVVTFQLMLGNNNALYRFLYDHVTVFQIFRNISKLAPALYLLILVATFMLLRRRLRDRAILIAVTALAACALAYNLPFWTYQDSFFADRSVRAIPQYWSDAAAFIDANADPSSKVLALPAIYVNDIFDWGGKRTWVQGSLLDVLIRNESYRLSECCLGSTTFQADARSVFVPSTGSIRHLDVDYRRLTRLAKKYHLDYVVMSDDLLSEYQRSSDILRWLASAGYTRVATFGPVDIYRNPANFAPLVSAGGAPISRGDGLQYEIDIRGLKRPTDLVLREPYHSGWEAFAQAGTADSSIVSQLRRLFDTAGEIADHRTGGEDENVWRLGPAIVSGRYASIGLYFRPQLGFFAISLAGIGIFSLLLLALLARIVVRGEGRLLGRIAFAAAALALAIIPPLVASRMAERPAAPAKATARIVPEGARALLTLGSGPKTVASFRQVGIRNAIWTVGPCEGAIAKAAISVGPTGVAAVSVTPVSSGSCAIVVRAKAAEGGGAASTRIQVDVRVRGVLSLSRSKPLPQTSVVFTSPSSAPVSLPVFVGADQSVVPLKVEASSCAGISSVQQPEIPQGSTAHVTLDFAPIGPGSCRVIAAPLDPSLADGGLQIFVRTMGTLSFSPSRAATTLALAFADAHSRAQLVDFYKSFGATPLTLSIVGGDCASTIAVVRKPGSAPAVPSAAGATGRISVRPLVRGVCRALLTDQYDDTPVHLEVSVGPAAR